MKTLLMMVLLFLVAIPVQAAYKIEKIAENHVEIVYSKIVTDVNEKDVEVWDESTRQTYGQIRIDEEKVRHALDLIGANALDAAAYKQGLIDNAQADKDLMDELQLKMNKEVSK